MILPSLKILKNSNRRGFCQATASTIRFPTCRSVLVSATASVILFFDILSAVGTGFIKTRPRHVYTLTRSPKKYLLWPQWVCGWRWFEVRLLGVGPFTMFGHLPISMTSGNQHTRPHINYTHCCRITRRCQVSDSPQFCWLTPLI